MRGELYPEVWSNTGTGRRNDCGFRSESVETECPRAKDWKRSKIK